MLASVALQILPETLDDEHGSLVVDAVFLELLVPFAERGARVDECDDVAAAVFQSAVRLAENFGQIFDETVHGYHDKTLRLAVREGKVLRGSRHYLDAAFLCEASHAFARFDAAADAEPLCARWTRRRTILSAVSLCLAIRSRSSMERSLPMA